MPVKQSARTQIIRDEVNQQVNDVNAIIKSLLNKRIAEMNAQNPEGQQRHQEQQADYGQLYNKVVDALESLKVEITTAPSSETVRQVKLMLNDIVKNFKGLSTSSVKAILDLIFNFIPFTKINKPPVNDFNQSEKNYTKANSKSSEIRRLIRDLLIKFVHDNSIKYLQADIYPKSYEEAKEYFNIEDMSKAIVSTENKAVKDRMNKKELEKTQNEASMTRHKRAQEADKLLIEQQKQDDDIKDQLLLDLYNYERDPANFSFLYNVLINGYSVFQALRANGEDTATLQNYNTDATYTNSLINDMRTNVKNININDALDEVSNVINAQNLTNRKAISKYLTTNIPYSDRTFTYLMKTKIIPTNIDELLNIFKIKNNIADLIPKINII
jgi:hypothetical protein